MLNDVQVIKNYWLKLKKSFTNSTFKLRYFSISHGEFAHHNFVHF